MTIEETIFRKVRLDADKMLSYGFKKNGEAYVYEQDFMDGAFHMILTADDQNHIFGNVIENEFGEEYLPLRVMGAQGEFVIKVREAYEELLTDIAEGSGIPVLFDSDQANRITAAIAGVYGDSPDFPWEDDVNKDYGVFRHSDNDKWYGLMMYTEETNLKTEEEKKAAKEAAAREKKQRAKERKLREEAKKAGRRLPPKKRDKKKSESDVREVKKLNIINLKIRKEDGPCLRREPGIYPAFHMNQNSWISLKLDDTMTDERVMELVAQSYALTGKKTSSRRRPDGRGVWIVPANPRYYDIVGIFSQTDDTFWKQGKGIETGDIVYMYVAVPYSAILYKCTVTKAHSSRDFGMELMDIHIDERYDPALCTLEKMKQFHVTTVRGPRFMPEELEEFISKS